MQRISNLGQVVNRNSCAIISKFSTSSKVKMPQAKWNGAVVADAKDGEVVLLEGNTYFPPTSVKKELLKETKETYTCPWKGTCTYYDVVVDGKTNPGAAWVYPTPKEKAANIKGFFAFWKGVQVS